MRSNEERVAEVKRRIAEKERQKKLRRSRIAAVSAVAACLVLIVVLSLFMPVLPDSSGLAVIPIMRWRRVCLAKTAPWVYHYRAAGLFSWCVRDHFVFPYPPAEPGRTEHGG